MNGNRMKYASTPTYGMQKRSFLKKPAPAVRQASEAPDFSKAPDAMAGMPFQPGFPQQPMFAQPPVFQQPQPTFHQQPAQPTFAPGNAFYPQTGAIPMQQPAQIPFAAPSFVMQKAGMPLPPTQPASAQLPLGNTVPPLQNSGSFSTRAQGFVPPKPPVQPVAQAAAPQGRPTTAPFATMPPFGGMNANAAPQQQPMGFAPSMQQMPPYQAPNPAQPAMQPQQPVWTPAAAPVDAHERRAFDFDRLWGVFLFGVLPLFFIATLFLPNALDFLRYIFMGFTAVGLGVMWYRQMYTPSARLIVSMVFVALCVASIAMLMQGGSDVRQTSTRMPQTAAAQQQVQSADAVPAAVQTTPEPLPVETPAPVVGPSEAERRLELFMSLWQMNSTSEMVHLVQPSWCSQQENPSQELFKVLMNRTPEDFVIEEISGTETDNSRTITMRATISKNNNKAPTIYRFMVMMVKEGNEWYVNPNSLATNDEVQTVDENVVNNKNAVGTVTEPPRTTVTPPPPGSTLLYYNEGANYYHMDPNCVSVKSEYLPFDFSFAYTDLKSVMSQYGLSPCLKCNAPTNTLN